jgi:microcystin-dependent protein
MELKVSVGNILLFAGNFAPVGWLPCDGRLLPIAQNPQLFAIIGTTYGGDGRIDFALPKLPNLQHAIYVIAAQGQPPQHP